MKALVYEGPGKKSWKDVPNPKILQPTDVIVKMDATTICGTDLHILKGDVPEVAIGRILGHEGIGVVTEVGSGVSQLCVATASFCRASARAVAALTVVKVSTVTASTRGRCRHCWIFGYMIDGTQAEFVRVPFAENSVYKIPADMTDAEASCSPTSCPPD